MPCRGAAPLPARLRGEAGVPSSSSTQESLMSHSVLVTGGAGYIGSHVVQQLLARGERVVGNVGDRALLARVLARHRVDAVLHFAAHTVVPESLSNPLKYYGNNTC